MTDAEFLAMADEFQKNHKWTNESFDQLLLAWREATKDFRIVGRVYIGIYQVTEEFSHNVYLIPCSHLLFFIEEPEHLDCYVLGGTYQCGYRDEITIDLIKWVVPRISPALVRHFEKIQEDIADLSKVGQEIRQITSCLER